MTTAAVELEVWSDIACPWCWVGLKNLEAARQLIEGELDDENLSITWRSFELNTDADTSIADGVDYVAKLAAKYQLTTAEAQGAIDRMTSAGAARGIDFRFDRISPSNTFNAHRLLAWARTHGQQYALKQELFRAYLHKGLSLNDPDVLVNAATKVGLDNEEAQKVVSSDAYTPAVLSDRTEARSQGVKGVPFFLINSQVALSGAQPPEVLAQALLDAQAAAQPDHDIAGQVCTPDGCTP